MKTIEKIGVMSLAKIQALIGLIIGFLYGILLFIVEKIDPSAFAQENTASQIPLGTMALFLGPVGGLVYGFLGGLLIAYLYNLLAKLIGGIKLEFKEK
ncbi:MAG: hypothetical protein AABW41_02460 [Nanoarchaeota archaeon]